MQRNIHPLHVVISRGKVSGEETVVRLLLVLEAGEDVLLSQERADGWMEQELGEFYNEEGDYGDNGGSRI